LRHSQLQSDGTVKNYRGMLSGCQKRIKYLKNAGCLRRENVSGNRESRAAGFEFWNYFAGALSPLVAFAEE
jgi:hypothetical protein